MRVADPPETVSSAGEADAAVLPETDGGSAKRAMGPSVARGDWLWFRGAFLLCSFCALETRNWLDLFGPTCWIWGHTI